MNLKKTLICSVLLVIAKTQSYLLVFVIPAPTTVGMKISLLVSCILMFAFAAFCTLFYFLPERQGLLGVVEIRTFLLTASWLGPVTFWTFGLNKCLMFMFSSCWFAML